MNLKYVMLGLAIIGLIVLSGCNNLGTEGTEPKTNTENCAACPPCDCTSQCEECESTMKWSSTYDWLSTDITGEPVIDCVNPKGHNVELIISFDSGKDQVLLTTLCNKLR